MIDGYGCGVAPDTPSQGVGWYYFEVTVYDFRGGAREYARLTRTVVPVAIIEYGINVNLAAVSTATIAKLTVVELAPVV
jgi:hypothetical protein